MRLPSETEEAFKARLNETQSDQWVIRRYLREANAFEKSPTVYIGRVVEGQPAKSPYSNADMPWALVRPLYAIKGELPQGARKLSIAAMGSCDLHGDGDAASSAPGTVVFVFEGLPKSEVQPNGITSIVATDARTFELLDPYYKFATERQLGSSK